MEFWNRIPHAGENAICGAIGALILLVYQIHQAMPDIRAVASTPESFAVARRQSGTVVGWVIIHGAVSLLGAALVTALLIRPQESYGAIVTGMTWTAIVKNYVKPNANRKR